MSNWLRICRATSLANHPGDVLARVGTGRLVSSPSLLLAGEVSTPCPKRSTGPLGALLLRILSSHPTRAIPVAPSTFVSTVSSDFFFGLPFYRLPFETERIPAFIGLKPEGPSIPVCRGQRLVRRCTKVNWQSSRVGQEARSKETHVDRKRREETREDMRKCWRCCKACTTKPASVAIDRCCDREW